MKIHFFAIVFFILSTCPASAQEKEIFVDTVEISTTRNHLFAIGVKTTTLDSSDISRFPAGSLADLLSRFTSISVKSYGAGGIATPSSRGTGAEHTAVLWNGFPVNNRGLGLADLSLLPAFFIDEAEFRHGPSGSLYGSSAVGGTVFLGSEDVPGQSGWKVTMSSGSFNQSAMGLKWKQSNNRLTHATRIFNQVAGNSFPFINTTKSGNPAEVLQHASQSQFSIMESIRLDLSAKHSLRTGAWLTISQREIPPTMTQSVSTAVQSDSTLRSFLEWKTALNSGHFIVRSAWMQDVIRYRDKAISLNEGSILKTLTSEAEIRKLIAGKFLLNGGIMFSSAFADNDNYGKPVNENRAAAFAGLKFPAGKSTVVSATMRQDVLQNKLAPLVPTIGLQQAIWKDKLLVKANIARSFNFPSMNMRYWIPGGDLHLLAERGYSAESGLLFHSAGKKTEIQTEATVFYSRLKEWLQWQPSPSGFWIPVNLKEVASRGLESSARTKYRARLFSMEFSLRYSYTHSSNVQIELSGNPAILGKQLIYIPVHNAGGDIGIEWKHAAIVTRTWYTGSRFTTADNISSLPSYWIQECDLEYRRPDMTIGFRISNLFDVNYQSIETRPMPGRSFVLRFDLNIKTKRY